MHSISKQHTPTRRHIPCCALFGQQRVPAAYLCLARLRLRLPAKLPMFIVDFMLPTLMAMGWLPSAAWPAAPAGIARAPVEAAARVAQNEAGSARWHAGPAM